MSIRPAFKSMKSRNVTFITGALVCVLFAPAISQSADDWVNIEDPAELRALFSNKTFKGIAPDMMPFVSHYSADGRGLFIQGTKRIPRTWKVQGKEVCATDATDTYCYAYQRQRDKPNEIRGQNKQRGWTVLFTVEDGIPQF